MKQVKSNVLIIGAGIAGKELLGELNKHSTLLINVVGFIDDDFKKFNKQIGSVRVLGNIDQLDQVIKQYRISEVFISIPSAEGKTIRRIIEKCQEGKVKFRIVPRLLEIIRGKVALNQTREIKIEDLLGRAIVKSEQKVFYNEFRGKKILVTGAAGSIGSEVCRQLIQFNPEMLYALDWWENGLYGLELELNKLAGSKNYSGIIANIQESDTLKNIIHDLKPDIIFHAAAFKHVPLMQRFPQEAVKNNVFGTWNLAAIAYEESVEKFIFISTDKAANPSSVMGTTKMLGEKIAKHFNARGKTKYISVRFGNVLGSSGSVVPVFTKQIAEGGPVTVTDPDMVRFFMTTSEAVQLVLRASILGQGGEIFILDMGEAVRIYDLARLMISLAGYVPEKDIEIVFTGRRPGEKLAEVLSAAGEEIIRTSNDKVFLIKPDKDDNINYIDIIEKLKSFIKENNSKEICDTLKVIAPNIQINNLI